MPGSPGTAPPAAATVADLGEHALLARLRARVPPPPAWVSVGIGDDAAVVEPPRNQLEVLTTDVLVEGVHFDRRFSTAADVGHKALAVNLSDLAAMGAEPRAALLSLALPASLAVADFDALLDGFLALAARYRLALVGGNLSQSPGPLVVDVTAVGAARRRRVLTRAGGRPGDELFLSGRVGGAAAGLARLQALAGVLPGDDDDARAAVERYRRPEPRVRLGLLVGRNRAASACVDLSDGLADAVAPAGRRQRRRRRRSTRARSPSTRARAPGSTARGATRWTTPWPAEKTTSCCSRCRGAGGGPFWRPRNW